MEIISSRKDEDKATCINHITLLNFLFYFFPFFLTICLLIPILLPSLLLSLHSFLLFWFYSLPLCFFLFSIKPQSLFSFLCSITSFCPSFLWYFLFLLPSFFFYFICLFAYFFSLPSLLQTLFSCFLSFFLSMPGLKPKLFPPWNL